MSADLCRALLREQCEERKYIDLGSTCEQPKKKEKGGGERKLTVLGCLQASQSLVSVGSRPMLQHLYRPNATPAS